MKNHRARLTLFLSSYSPLLVILAMRAWNTNRTLAAFFGTLALVSLVFLSLFLRKARAISPELVKVEGVSSMASETLSYVVTYLFPFLGVDYSDTLGLLSLAILFMVLAVIYVRANLIHVNPLLLMVGVQVFRIRTGSGKEIAVLTRRDHIPIHSQLRLIPLGDYVSMEKQDEP